MLNLRSIHPSSDHSGDETYTEGHPDFIQTNILGDLAATIDFSNPSDSSASSTQESLDSSTTEVGSANSDVVIVGSKLASPIPYVRVPCSILLLEVANNGHSSSQIMG